MDLGPHAVFIVWAYLGVGICTLLLIAFTIFDSRRIRKRLAALDARGIRRRSDSAS